MTARNHPITEADLLAFADGQLSPERRATVEAFLAANPERSAEVAHWRRQNEALTALFGAVVKEPVPARLDPHAIAAPARNRSRFGWAQLAAAALVLLAVGVGAGWAGRQLTWPDSPKEALIEDALSAHALYVKESRHAVEVAAADHDHLVSWLSNRIERPIVTPDLSAEGFSLVGGRLLPPGRETDTGPAAQLMYENAAAERVTVYITAALPDGKSVFEVANRDRLEALYWADNRITCTVVGDLPEAEMKAVGKKIYQQFTWRPDTPPANG
jgi:anti-sigma factor RsiW